MVQKDSLIKNIIEILSKERLNIQTLSEQGLLDEHNYWEDIVCHLLNVIFGYDFVNLNRGKKNYPGIDLGDKESAIGVQVSATKTSAKINRSLEKVKTNKVYEEFPHFIMFVLGKKQASYTIDSFDSRIQFDKSKDIWDFDYLISAIKELNFDEIKEIHDYLDRELNKQQADEFRTNVAFILAYLNGSLEWLRLAAENGQFYMDAYSCDRYNERCEKLAGILPQDEYNQLYSMLTEMNQTVEYIRQGCAYLNKRTKSSFGYKDINTIRLGNCVMNKASSAYAKKDIIQKLEKYI